MSVMLEALDGRDPLAFTAALGVLRVLESRDVPLRLSWDDRTATARLHGVGTVDDVVGELVAAFKGTGDALAVGLPAGLPPRKAGSKGPDPSHLDRSEFSRLCQEHPAAWVSALWTDLALDKNGRCERTPFSAPMGQQTLRSMFENPKGLVSDAPEARLGEALTGWRRIAGFTGENYDIRAVQEAAESQQAKGSLPRGVPGATWLALCALPYFRMSAAGSRPTTVAWHSVGRGRRRLLVWPLWRAALDRAAVEVLLDHPLLEGAAREDRAASRAELDKVQGELAALGVFAVMRAARRQTSAGKSDGILVPERVL